GAGAYVGRQIREREDAAELRGPFAKVTTVEAAARRMGVCRSNGRNVLRRAKRGHPGAAHRSPPAPFDLAGRIPEKQLQLSRLPTFQHLKLAHSSFLSCRSKTNRSAKPLRSTDTSVAEGKGHVRTKTVRIRTKTGRVDEYCIRPPERCGEGGVRPSESRDEAGVPRLGRHQDCGA